MLLFYFRFPAVDWSRLLFTSSFLYHLGTFQVCAGMVWLMMRVWLFPPHKSTYLPHISRVKLDFSDILRLFQISSSSSRHKNIAKKLKRCDSKDNTMMVSIMRTCRVLYSALFQWHDDGRETNFSYLTKLQHTHHTIFDTIMEGMERREIAFWGCHRKCPTPFASFFHPQNTWLDRS